MCTLTSSFCHKNQTHFYPKVLHKDSFWNRGNSRTCVFLHSASATWFYHEFWLVHGFPCPLCEWLEWLLLVLFYEQKLKTFYFLSTSIFLTHRGCFLSSCHKLFIPPNHHIRKISDKEEDTTTSRSNVCSGKKHRDQETQHDCSDHKHKQEKKNDDWVAVPQNLSTFQDSNKQRDCDDH